MHADSLASSAHSVMQLCCPIGYPHELGSAPQFVTRRLAPAAHRVSGISQRRTLAKVVPIRSVPGDWPRAPPHGSIVTLMFVQPGPFTIVLRSSRFSFTGFWRSVVEFPLCSLEVPQSHEDVVEGIRWVHPRNPRFGSENYCNVKSRVGSWTFWGQMLARSCLSRCTFKSSEDVPSSSAVVASASVRLRSVAASTKVFALVFLVCVWFHFHCECVSQRAYKSSRTARSVPKEETAKLPPFVPVRGCLERTKHLMQDDIYTGRGHECEHVDAVVGLTMTKSRVTVARWPLGVSQRTCRRT